jgi:hypothetical protein
MNMAVLHVPPSYYVLMCVCLFNTMPYLQASSCKCVLNFCTEIHLRPLSRHRLMRENSCADVGWIHLAYDGRQKWAILNTKMKCGI